ncbi:hypothetical protein APA_4847 [Pseudanabaena sp. lw0831]|nr:hypothetical protein APA_4847 [Pseudanabaena sp. lw0831]
MQNQLIFDKAFQKNITISKFLMSISTDKSRCYLSLIEINYLPFLSSPNHDYPNF